MSARIPRLLIALSLVAAAAGAERSLTLHLDVGEGTGDDPMIMVWLETTAGDFVKTLHLFTKSQQYYSDLTVWAKGHDATAGDRLDGVIGPTISWNSGRSATIPVRQGRIDLLSGGYQIHIEQRRDKGGHYKKLRIPLPSDFTSRTIQSEGYIKALTASVSP